MKYKMTDETKEVYGITLHRIQALEDNGSIKAGDLLGWIEKESNLSQDGRCVVMGNAKVYGDAEVCGDARVYGDAEVFGDAEVCGDARVYGDAEVFGDAKVYGNATVFGNATVRGDAIVCGNAGVYGDAEVFGDAKVCGDAEVCGDAKVCGDAEVTSNNDILWIAPIGSRSDTTTFYKNKDGDISVSCGCFTGVLEEFEAAVSKTHGSNRYAKEYRIAIQLAKQHILGEGESHEEDR